MSPDLLSSSSGEFTRRNRRPKQHMKIPQTLTPRRVFVTTNQHECENCVCFHTAGTFFVLNYVTPIGTSRGPTIVIQRECRPRGNSYLKRAFRPLDNI